MKTKRTSLWIALVMCIAFVMTGCEGPEGPQGPEGNANVTLYTFGSITFTGSTTLTIPNVTKETMDASILLAYYNPSNEAASTWYQMPGFGSMGAYNIRTFWYQSGVNYTFGIRAMDPSGSSYTTSLTFTAVRIFLVPASNTVPVGVTPGKDGAISLKKSLQPEDLTKLTYQEACDYFGIEE